MSVASLGGLQANKDLTIRLLKKGCKIEDASRGVSVRLDEMGRWCTYRRQNEFYRRCLDGSVVKGAGEETVPESFKTQLIPEIQKQVSSWERQVNSSLLKPLLARAAQYNTQYYDSLARFYSQIYPEAVPILPPDRYRDLVIQPVIGCPNRACTFCAFYKEKPFKVLDEEAFKRHLSGVKTLFGADLAGKNGLFLGSANPMALSQRRLMNCLGHIESELGKFQRGIAAFSDPDFSAKRTEMEWSALHGGGIKHLIIGLETGWGKLRGKLGKAKDLTRVRQAVADYKKAGISIGLTVLTGACPESDVINNVLATTSFVASLNLERSDLVYLSPLSGQNSCETLREKERKMLKKALAAHIDAKIVSYQMQRFHYYT